MDDLFDIKELARELPQWVVTSPTAGAGLFTGEPFPTLPAMVKFEALAHRLWMAIQAFDRQLGGQPVSYVADRKSALLTLCDALYSIWNSDDDDGGDLLLHYKECEGYGVKVAVEVSGIFDEIESQLFEIGRVLKKHQADPAYALGWEWRIRSPQKVAWPEADTADRDGRLLAWWAPPDALDEAVKRHAHKLPDSSLLWSRVEAEINRRQHFDTSECIAVLELGDKLIPREFDRSLAQALAVAWCQRRRELAEPLRNAFGWANFSEDPDGPFEYQPFDWGVGLFEESEQWPVLEHEVEECGSNIGTAAHFALEHIRGATEPDEPAPPCDQTTWTPSRPASPAEWADRLRLSWRKTIRPMHNEGKLRGKMLNRKSWVFAIEDLAPLGYRE